MGYSALSKQLDESRTRGLLADPRQDPPPFSGFVPKDFVELGRAILKHPSHVRVAQLAVDAELADLLQRFERIHPGPLGLFSEVREQDAAANASIDAQGLS